MLQQTGGAETPPLSILQLDMSVNTTDTQLLSNLAYTKSLGLAELQLREPHERVLAIVGSGPSLKEYAGLIPPDCDVMALNAAYKLLQGKGRKVDYFAMLDARPENINFVQTCDTRTRHFLASQCHPDVVDKVGGSIELFHLTTPTTKKVFPNAELQVGGGGTIGLTALALALVLGYRKVILYGFDSSHEGDASHAVAQPQNEGLKILDVWVQDRMYRTTHAMAQQVMDFFPFYEAIKAVAPDFEIHLTGKGLLYDYVFTNNNEPTRERELAKYVEAYKHDDYGMTQERKDGLDELIGELKGESYLDVSTGRGETLELARKHGFSVVSGTETVPELLNEHVGHGILPNISAPSKYYDVVSLIEVIEHLLPEDVRPSLDELTRLAKKHILISAAVTAHWLGGVNLHPSARPEEEWQALFTEVWGDKVRRVRNLGQSPCWRVDL